MLEKILKAIENDEIRTAICGGAFWNSNGMFLSAEEAEALSHTDFPFNLSETNRARGEQERILAAK